MEYKPKKTTCSRCGQPRRKGGRLCAECHAKNMRAMRAVSSPELQIEKTLESVVRKKRGGSRRPLSADFKKKLVLLASHVAQQIDDFNRSTMGAA